MICHSWLARQSWMLDEMSVHEVGANLKRVGKPRNIRTRTKCLNLQY